MESNILTKEEIEAAGFNYEPDESKCSPRKIRVHFDCNYYESGSWTERTTPEITDEWRKGLVEVLSREAYHFTHIHKVFVPPISPLGGRGVACRWLMISGHGDALTKKWHGTGLLEGLKPNQLSAASFYLNQVAQELVAKATGLVAGTPEHSRWDSICAIALPVGRTIFDKYPTRPDPKFIVEDVARFWDEKKELYEALKTGIAQDHDQRFQDLYMDYYDARGTISTVSS